MDSITGRDLLELHRSTIKVIEGLQKQIECLNRISGYQHSMILLLSGGRPEQPEVKELSEQARREVEELERLFRKDEPPAAN